MRNSKLKTLKRISRFLYSKFIILSLKTGQYKETRTRQLENKASHIYKFDLY